jgi:hypothetical protein
VTCRFGTAANTDRPQDSPLDAPNIDDEHALFESAEELGTKCNHLAEVVKMHPIGTCQVNGKACDDLVRLRHDDGVIFGNTSKCDPTEAMRMKMRGEKLPEESGPSAAQVAALEAARTAMVEVKARLEQDKAVDAELRRKLVEETTTLFPNTPVRENTAAAHAEAQRNVVVEDVSRPAEVLGHQPQAKGKDARRSPAKVRTAAKMPRHAWPPPFHAAHSPTLNKYAHTYPHHHPSGRLGVRACLCVCALVRERYGFPH